MDDAKHNEKKTDGVKRSKESNKTGPNNKDRDGEQTTENGDHETVIERLEKLVHFLKGTPKNEEFLEHIKKPLDYIEVSLKIIPKNSGTHLAVFLNVAI